MKYGKRQRIKKVAKVIGMMVITVVPIASGYCRGLFYEEQEPLEFEEFLHMKNKIKCGQKICCGTEEKSLKAGR